MSKSASLRRLLLVVLIATTFPLALRAQTSTAGLVTGVVTDSTGAVLPGGYDPRCQDFGRNRRPNLTSAKFERNFVYSKLIGNPVTDNLTKGPLQNATTPRLS